MPLSPEPGRARVCWHACCAASKPSVSSSRRTRLVRLLQEAWQLGRIARSDTHWSMPFAAALASGAPLLVGAYFGHLAYGLVSSPGGMVFLYLPATWLRHRMVWLMACAFGMVACNALGLVSHLVAPILVPMLIVIATLVMMCMRLYSVGPPGGLFFIMATAIGAYALVPPLGLNASRRWRPPAIATAFRGQRS